MIRLPDSSALEVRMLTVAVVGIALERISRRSITAAPHGESDKSLSADFIKCCSRFSVPSPFEATSPQPAASSVWNDTARSEDALAEFML